MARRYWSLHHNLQDGENVVFHREHRSERNRRGKKLRLIGAYRRESRRKFKNFSKSGEFRLGSDQNWGKRRSY
jgi:hypothetical protein